uniref:Uncharacterized protein n=1 Tax=Oryza glumipatula TaxID=40148 RepID=A0A0E0BFB9_9ORYZ
MHGRFRGLGFRGGGGGRRSHRGGAAARTPSRLASGISARRHRLRMCSTPPAGAGEVVRHPGADSLEMDRLHRRRHRRLKGEARGAFSLETSLKIHAISLHPGASIEHQLSYVFANCGCNSIFNVPIDISGVSMVTTFLAEVPLAKSLTGVLKICGQDWLLLVNCHIITSLMLFLSPSRFVTALSTLPTAKVTDFYDCDPANPGQPFAPFLFFKLSKKRQPVISFNPMIPLMLNLSGMKFDCVLQTMIQAKIFLLISIFGDE